MRYKKEKMRAEIERERKYLNELAKENLTSDKVLWQSRRVDELIMKYIDRDNEIAW